MESNPIMSRLKSQKKVLNNEIKPVQTNNIKPIETNVLEEKPKVYKPPIRGNSIVKANKNLNTTDSEMVNTTNTSSTSSTKCLETETNKNNGKSTNYNQQIEEINNYMDNMDINKKGEYNINTYNSKIGNQSTFIPFTTATHKSSLIRNNFSFVPTLEKNSSILGFNQSKINDRPIGPINPLREQNQNLSTVSSVKDFNSYVPRRTTPIRSQKVLNQSYVINLEDLMLLEEKMTAIINNFLKKIPAINECFDWWNFYFNCSLCGKLEHYFRDEENKAIIRDYTNLELLALIICYDSSHDKDLFSTILVMLNSILSLLHHNFLIISEYILSKVSSESQENIWVGKLRDLVKYKMPLYNNENLNYYVSKVSSYISRIKLNNASVYDYIRIVLKNYPKNSETAEILLKNFKNITTINLNNLNELFRSKIIRVVNKNASVLASSLINLNENNFEQVAVPYLKKKPLKEYTLVLDLDETLIHFKIDSQDENKGLLRLRPGIFDFLDAVSALYEIVIFTAATQDYADPILDAIERDRLYFDYRLYRQHCIIFENDFVKDISRLGRDLSKIIIVDNMPQNFRLQKENGIFIKTFYGEDPDDTALTELIPILTKIIQDKKDVRISLLKFRDEILKRISSNIEKQSNINKQHSK